MRRSLGRFAWYTGLLRGRVLRDGEMSVSDIVSRPTPQWLWRRPLGYCEETGEVMAGCAWDAWPDGECSRLAVATGEEHDC